MVEASEAGAYHANGGPAGVDGSKLDAQEVDLEVCCLDTLGAWPVLEERSARPQVLPRCRGCALPTEVWPEHWGVTLAQCRELLAKCQKDPKWKPSNSVYALVEDFVKPMTEGTGIGYALLVNQDAPLEVTVMVSHAWGENAQEFFDTLERSVGENEAMFICALSLYQCGDSAGPSISAQLGTSAEESPFRRVLDHIASRGKAAGWMWRHRRALRFVPSLCVIAAMVLFYLPVGCGSCIPTLDGCATGHVVLDHSVKVHQYMGAMCTFPRWEFTYKPLPEHLKPFVPLALAFGALALVVHVALVRSDTYRGRMVCVPNRECDLYSRLWCCYEIFVATRLGVPVELAKTLAGAGLEGGVREATCSSDQDTQRIFSEIETWQVGPRNLLRMASQSPWGAFAKSLSTVGSSFSSSQGSGSSGALSTASSGWFAPSHSRPRASSSSSSFSRAASASTSSSVVSARAAEPGSIEGAAFDRVDEAIRSTTHRAKRSAQLAMFQWLVPFVTIFLAEPEGNFAPGHNLFMSEICSGILSMALSGLVFMVVATHCAAYRRGVPSLRRVLSTALAVIGSAAALRVIDRYWLPLSSSGTSKVLSELPPFHHCFTFGLFCGGCSILLVGVLEWLTRGRFIRWHWRAVFLAVALPTALVAMTLRSAVYPRMDQYYPIAVWYLSFRFAPLCCFPAFLWSSAAQWGVHFG